MSAGQVLFLLVVAILAGCALGIMLAAAEEPRQGHGQGAERKPPRDWWPPFQP